LRERARERGIRGTNTISSIVLNIVS